MLEIALSHIRKQPVMAGLFVISQIITIPPILFLGFWTLVGLVHTLVAFFHVVSQLLTQGPTPENIFGLFVPSIPMLMGLGMYILLLKLALSSYTNFNNGSKKWLLWQVLLIGLTTFICYSLFVGYTVEQTSNID